jgi:pimeloyl-ACP methyl ester carboxylesterase
MYTLRINGTDLACEEHGEGEPLVLVHGALGDLRSWEYSVAGFATHFRAITYSRRWHCPNAREIRGGRYTVEVHADDLIELLHQLGPSYLVGHSYGAAICAEVALQQPGLVRSLVLAEPSIMTLLVSNTTSANVFSQAVAATTQVLTRMRQRDYERALSDYLEIILGPRGFERLPPLARAVMFENLHTLEPMLNGMNASRPFTVEHAGKITTPTLLLDGGQSPPLFRLVQDELDRSMPNTQRITLPAVSHGMYLENPEAFSRTVLEFLATMTPEPLPR